MQIHDNQNPQSPSVSSRKIALVSVQAGCLTLILAGIALTAGLLIDAWLGTAPQWTIIFLLGSMPLAFGGVFWLIRRSVNRRRKIGDTKSDIKEEEI